MFVIFTENKKQILSAPIINTDLLTNHVHKLELGARRETWFLASLVSSDLPQPWCMAFNERTECAKYNYSILGQLFDLDLFFLDLDILLYLTNHII